MIRESYAKALEKVRQGLRRFWAFHLCMAAVAALYVLGWHAVICDGTMENLQRGICWGALAGVFVRLVGEWRRWPQAHLSAGFVTVVIGALGCWFWFRIGESSPHYRLWMMLCCGTSVSLVAACIAVLYRYADERSLVSRLTLNGLGASGSAAIVISSLMLCILAFQELVTSVDEKAYADVAVVAWFAIVPVGFMSFLPGRGGDDGVSDRATAFLFWLLLPASLILLGILYLYLGKIAVTRTMPSGELNWFGSVALAAYAFFWLALRDSPRRFFQAFVRWGWALLLPVLAAQVVGIVIRYRAYGLSATRFAGMITLTFGIMALVLAALNRRPHGLFVYVAVAGLVFTVTPLNIIDVPIRNQEARLRAALERNGLIKDGALELGAGIRISDEDAKVVDGAWKYLESGAPTVWHRSPFMAGLRTRVASLCRDRKISGGSLVKLLGPEAEQAVRAAAESRKEYGTTSNWTSVYFQLPEGIVMPVGGYTHLRLYDGWMFKCRSRKGRCYVTVPAEEGREKETFEITEQVDRVLKAAGCDGVVRAGLPFDLKPELSVWPLRPGLALAVGELGISGKVGERFSELHLPRCALLSQEKGLER